MRSIESALQARIKALFARCPALCRFAVRDRSGLPDHLDPTALEGELFIFEMTLSPRLGRSQYDEIYGEISAVLSAAVLALPGARVLLRERSFVRALH